MELPIFTQSGTYTAKIIEYNYDDSIAGCIRTDVKVK
jgi:hypothetical protein